MNKLLYTPIESWPVEAWRRIDPAARAALLIAAMVSLLAFGFEATNLTLHHDDVNQIFIEDTILGHYLGRFGTGWIHYYTQGAHFMPFVQMSLGIMVMAAYGVLVGWFWGARRTADLALVASIVCVFPYMAHVYQYNTTMATYSVAHLLAAGAVVVSVRMPWLWLPLAAMLYVGAFSIYQGVAANAATIFLVWWLMRLLFPADDATRQAAPALGASVRALAAALLGGALYFVAISFMTIEFDSYQSAEKALKPGAGIDLRRALPTIAAGTRAFLLWPEAYFPNFLKKLQLLFLGATALGCLWLPRGAAAKLAALVLLGAIVFAPRSLQLLHAEGHFHELTLTAYALMVAAAVLAVRRSAPVAVRNLAWIGGVVMVAAYVVQCAWISTVGQLNTMAHYTTMTQVLTRLRALPESGWDGKSVVVVGDYGMRRDYPFKRATGVAPEYMRAHHMNLMARLMRDEASFTMAPDKNKDPEMAAYVAARPVWPHPDSVTVYKGTGLVVLSKP